MKTAEELRRDREAWRALCRREAPHELARLGERAFHTICDRVRHLRLRAKRRTYQ